MYLWAQIYDIFPKKNFFRLFLIKNNRFLTMQANGIVCEVFFLLAGKT